MTHRIQYISWIFVLLLAVTVLNLFFKPRNGGMLSHAWKAAVSRWTEAKDPPPSWDHAAQCVLRGYRCPDDQECDCRKCRGLRKFHVTENDSIVVLDRRLEPGTYCLPQQGRADGCDQRTQISLYTAAGWTCVDRHRGVFRSHTAATACHHPLAKDNRDNYLVNRTTGQRVKEKDMDVIDFYERDASGVRRKYGCHCGSLDVFGHVMVSPLPFLCAVDYCLRDLKGNPFTKDLGWKDGKCNCGPFQHLIPPDETSPCVDITTHRNDEKVVLRVECTTRMDFERKPWYCPPGHTGGVLSVEEKVVIGKETFDFLDKHLLN